MSLTWNWRLVFSGMSGIPLESRVCLRKSESLLKKQSYVMRMKTRVFNCTSKWLQLAEVHWQSAGERKKKTVRRFTTSFQVQFSSVQSSHCQGLVIWVFRNFKFVFLFNWHLREQARRNSQLLQHCLPVLISASQSVQPFLKSWNLLICPDIPNSYGTQRLIIMFTKYRLLTVSKKSRILVTAPCLISLLSILH